jgi:hypothetical protein
MLCRFDAVRVFFVITFFRVTHGAYAARDRAHLEACNAGNSGQAVAFARHLGCLRQPAVYRVGLFFVQHVKAFRIDY